jgi:hypothetical protein
MKIGGQRTAVSYSSSASMQTLPLGWVNRQREEPNISTEGGSFVRWHEPDDARVSCPDLQVARGGSPRAYSAKLTVAVLRQARRGLEKPTLKWSRRNSQDSPKMCRYRANHP